MKLYRLYTEHVAFDNWDTINKLVAKHIDSFTTYLGEGYYKGEKEETVVIEVVSFGKDLEPQLEEIAKDICDLNNQESVLLTVQTLDNARLIEGGCRYCDPGEGVVCSTGRCERLGV